MSRKKIDFPTLRIVVDSLGDIFTTKDVSEDPRTKQANQQYRYHSQYHAFVGGALSDHRAELNIIEIQKGTARGSRWQKARSLYGEGTSQSSDSEVAEVFDRGYQNIRAKSEGYSKEYAVEQTNKEIYELKSKIEKIRKSQGFNGCCFGYLVLIVLIISVGLILLFLGLVDGLIVALILSFIVLIVGLFSLFNTPPEEKELIKRINELEEKKKKLEFS